MQDAISPKEEPDAAQSTNEYLVHDVLVRPATNEILHGSVSQHLEPKSMEVLVLLCEHAGAVISRDEIQSRIWRDVTVGEDSLTNAIIKLRKAFGDNARKPSIIETIPKRGYRMIAPVIAQPAAQPFAQPGAAQQEHLYRQPAAQNSKGRLVGMSWQVALGALVVLVIGVATVFKGISQNREGQDTRPSTAQTGKPATDDIVIAIADFGNISGEPQQDYLASGIEETILHNLARLPRLKVQRYLSRPYTDGGPQYVLEGSVLRRNDTIRITARLLAADSGTIVSSHKYDRPFIDLIQIEKDIQTSIIDKLALQISDAEIARLARSYTDNIDAYDLFLRAQQALLSRDREGNMRARALYKQSIERDPQFARAYAGTALTYAAEFRNAWSDNGDGALAHAMELAQTALEIAPDLPEQYWVIGYVKTQQQDFVAAEAALKKALDYDPDYADAHALLGGIYTYTGAPEKTLPLIRRAVQLQPRAGYLYFLLLGRAYYFLGNCEQAEINLKEALLRNSSNLEAHLYLTGCLVQQEKHEDAEWEVQEIENISPQFSIASWLETYPMVDEEQKKKLSSDLLIAGLQ